MKPLHRLIALAALSASLGGSAQGKEPDPGIQILTLNTWGLPFPIARSSPWRRFPGIRRMLDQRQADIVGLQEVWRGARRLLDGLEGLRRGPDTRHLDSGLALVSPHPISNLSERSFTAARGVDRLKQKGMLTARVELPEVGPIEVLVTHLQAGGGPANAAVRGLQVEQLLEVVDGWQGPTLVMGDFNLSEGEPVDDQTAARLLAAGFVDTGGAEGNRAPTHADGQRYDRIYLRSPDGVLSVIGASPLPWPGGEALSDHLAVETRLRCRKGDPP